MTVTVDVPALPDALQGQPLLRVDRDGVTYWLLGTAHVSQSSADAVEAALEWQRFDAVAVELCEPRFRAITEPEALERMDLFGVIRDGKTGLVAANLALSAYQRRLAEQLGIEPGAEMKVAIAAAERHAVPVWKIDRDVGMTLRRAYAATGFWGRVKIASGLMAGLVTSDSVDADEIERLKEGDLLESAFSEFALRSEPLYRTLIAERDRYMAASLREHAQELGRTHDGAKVLAVVGAGHLKGLAQALAEDRGDPVRTQVELRTPPPPSRTGLWLTALLTTFVLGGFIYGFYRGEGIGTDVVTYWVLITGGLGALGCLAAGGHPLSIGAAFVSSPLTPLHPALASGTVSALVELWVRKPTVADFHALRDDVGTLRGWWRNRVARLFVNFFLTSLGTAIGVYLAGWQMLRALF